LLAVTSSYRNRPLPADLIVFGEVGLSGELRPVPNGQQRISEAAKHGFHKAIIPMANKPKTATKGLEVTAVNRLSQVLEKVSEGF
ncbi:MAG: magnesium chelatase domain-containing protein, partial [Gammaproteobacteria bacterium]